MVHGILAMQHPSERPKWWWVFVVGLAAFFITMPFHLEIFVILEMSRFFGMAMLALSMGFLWGFSGILSFGQTAFFGLGGYGFTVLALNTGETTGSVFFAVVLGAAGAGILGYFMIYGRISEIYLSVITLVFTLILEKGIRATSGDQYVIGKVRLNGQNGIPTVPQLDVPWNTSVQLDINWFFWVGAVVMILVYIGLRLLLTTPFGRVLVGGKGTLIGPTAGVFAIEHFKGWLGTQGVGQVTLVLGAVLILFVLVFQRGLLPSVGSLPGLWQDRAVIGRRLGEAAAQARRPVRRSGRARRGSGA